MKKLLLIAVMAVTGLTVSAQRKYNPTDVAQTRHHMTHKVAEKRSFQAAPLRNESAASMRSLGKKITLDASRLQPVQRTKVQPVLNQRQARMMRNNGRLVSSQVTNLMPINNVQTNAPRKEAAFRESYTGKGMDYYTKSDTAWTMLPAVAQTAEGESVNVLVDVIPLVPALKEALATIYPNGVPVTYTIEEGIVTIQPQPIASFEDKEGTTCYLTLFGANSDDEDGVINMQLAEDGLLKVTNGNWIALGEFANVPFDEEFGDNFLGVDELYVNVRYVYEGQPVGFTSERDYKAHGVDMSASQGVSWTMSLGKWTEDGEDIPAFLNVSPFDDMFSVIYPDGIPVEYKKEGNTYTIQPQVLGSMTDDDGSVEYLMIFSGTNEATGEIVFTIDADGKLTTIKDESILIAAWSTENYDPTYETYLGWYTYTDRVSYRLPGEPSVAPADLCVDPNELILFAGLGMSGYSYNDNLAVVGAYAPLSFRNGTLDEATKFEWLVKETTSDDENTITGTETNFLFNTKGNARYEDFTLTGFNGDAASEPYTFGYGHCPATDASGNPTGEARYEAAHFYAGETAGSFQFTDGTYATMTRQNPDGDLTFYTNWATPDIYESTSIAKIYSYQGKPATPLFLTGVTLPLVGFEAKDDFNLHISLYKCSRSATGRFTMGDLIAESDATIENVDDQYTSGLTAVVFDELYIEDEMGMSETLDYLFIEDEFIIVIDGWDNGTFSGVLGSQDITGNEINSTWFARTGYDDEMRYYTVWKPALFIGLNDATYGYLYTEDNTDLTFSAEGGTATIHVDPMFYGTDEETGQPTHSLFVESVSEDGEEADDIPEWLTFEVTNEDYTTATDVDEDGDEYTYFVNGIDYDLVVAAEALPEGVEGRSAEVVFMQTGALLKVKVTQGESQGITTVVTKEPLKNHHTYNLAGQRVGAIKGVVVKDGRKFIRK